MRFARIRLPVRIPDDYNLVFEVKRVRGRGTLNLGLVCGGKQCMVVIDGQEGTADGLNLIDGRAYANNESTNRRTGGFAVSRQTETVVVCEVRSGGIRVLADGQELFEWRGDPTRLSLRHFWAVQPKLRLFVGCDEASFEVSQIDLQSVSPVDAPPGIAIAKGSSPGRSGETKGPQRPRRPQPLANPPKTEAPNSNGPRGLLVGEFLRRDDPLELPDVLLSAEPKIMSLEPDQKSPTLRSGHKLVVFDITATSRRAGAVINTTRLGLLADGGTMYPVWGQYSSILPGRGRSWIKSDWKVEFNSADVESSFGLVFEVPKAVDVEQLRFV
ncbi:MAG: hypothetical protein CMJ48_02100 [Planctomycetaceae bacterium]|nr:hypothetical protein [Planctomycetaceae bacterium]